MSASSQSTAERLRVYIPLASDDGVVLASVATFKEAADEIDRLTEEVSRLRYAMSEIVLHLKVNPDPITALRIAISALPNDMSTLDLAVSAIVKAAKGTVLADKLRERLAVLDLASLDALYVFDCFYDEGDAERDWLPIVRAALPREPA